MGIFDPYGDFLQITWRTDDNGNKQSIQITNEPHKIIGNKIILKEIPDEFNKVTINGKYETGINSELTSNSYFKVDYNTGVVYFHSSDEGKSITVSQYYGRGYIQLFGKRIIIQDEDGLYVANNVEDALEEAMSKINNNNSRSTQIEQDAITRHNNHINSTTAHKAENITYSGKVSATNVKAAIDKQNDRIDTIVGQAGTSNTEIVDARTSVNGTVHPVLKNRLDGMENQLVEQNQQTTTLTHGLNVLNSDVASPLKVEFYGNSLVNLLGVKGRYNGVGSTGFKYIDIDYTVKSGKYYVVVVENLSSNVSDVQLLSDGGTPNYYKQAQDGNYKKFTPTADDNIQVRFYTSDTNTTTFNIALYEISTETYDKIGVSLGTDDVERMFPYIDSVKSARNVYVKVSGTNLIPPFSEWTLHANAKVIEPYKLELNATSANQNSFYKVNVLPNTTITFKVDGNGKLNLQERDANNSFIKDNAVTFTNGATKTITTTSTTKSIDVTLYNGESGTFTFTDPILNLGDTAKPFVAKNDSYLYAETVLAGNSNKKDILSQVDGQWQKLKWWESVTLDGSLGWSSSGTYTGFKRVKLTLGNVYDVNNRTTAKAVKDDGSILEYYQSVDGSNDQFALDSVGVLYITISDTDATGYDLTTSTGIKQYFTDKNYFLLYQRATPVTEPVTVEGSLNIPSGGAIVSVNSGGEFFESLTPDSTGQATLKYAAEKVLSVHDGANDVKFAVVNSNTIKITNYDSTKSYKANYIRLNKYDYTCNLNDVKATYSDSFKSSYNRTVEQINDQGTQLSINTNQIIDILVRLKAGGL